jgi:hypothetical protein
MFNTPDSSFQTPEARVTGCGGGKRGGKTYRWHTEAVSEGTHRTLCFRQRSQAKAFPILPSLASMVTIVMGGLGDSLAEADCCVWGSPIMMPSVREM